VPLLFDHSPGLPLAVAAAANGFQWHAVALTLGILLVAAVVGGVIAQRLHLPKVTAYLLVGLALGNVPRLTAYLRDEVGLDLGLLEALPAADLQYLVPLEKLAMALVLFGMGCHFTLPLVRRIFHRVLRISATELSFTFVLVSVGLLAVYWSRLGVHAWQPAILLGAMAMATAPATTILVLRENQAEGPVTEFVTSLVALNNLAAVVLFEVLFLVVFLANGQTAVTVHVELWNLARDLLGSVALGVVAGLVVSYASSLVAQRNRLVLLVGATTLIAGLCQAYDIPYLLTFLTMGATVANASERPQDLVGELDRWTGLLCVVFFVIHGAELDIGMLIKVGGIGAAYIALRTAGKYLGVYFGSGSFHEEAHIRPWLGTTMLSQAGAAIALSSLAVASGLKIGDFDLGKELQNIILGTVVVFELAGPILLRLALIRAGEIPVSQAIHHTTTTPWGELRMLVNRVMVSIGFEPWRGRSPEDITVAHVMRRHPKAIPAQATFEQVVDFIEHSRDNTYPVIGADGELVGIIRYVHLRDALFDADLGTLVRAEDLAIPAPRVLHPDDPVADTWQQFRKGVDDGIPVVTREAPHQLVGMVKRRDLYRIFKRGRQNRGAG
jgi:Kef-type K+ transport system membrane component KefB